MADSTSLGVPSEFLGVLAGGDLTLVCRDGDVLCHSQILSVSSRVFADMLSSTSTPSRLEVDDHALDWMLTLTVLYPISPQPQLGASHLSALIRISPKYNIERGMEVARTLASKVAIDAPSMFMKWVLTANDFQEIQGEMLVHSPEFGSPYVYRIGLQMDDEDIMLEAWLSYERTRKIGKRRARYQYRMVLLDARDPFDVNPIQCALSHHITSESSAGTLLDTGTLGPLQDCIKCAMPDGTFVVYVYGDGEPCKPSQSRMCLSKNVADRDSIWRVLDDAIAAKQMVVVDSLIKLVAEKAWMAKVDRSFADGLVTALRNLTLTQQARIWSQM